MEKSKRNRKETFKYPDYVCPRCNYTTEKKKHMVDHFKRKKLCPCSDPNNPHKELTTEIKEYVLQNRQYKPTEKPSDQKQTININNLNVNNYNQFNNFIKNMEYPTKAEKYVQYLNSVGKNANLLTFKEQIDQALFDAGYDTENLDRLMTDNTFELAEHTTDDHTETIDNITKTTSSRSLSGICYDAKTKKLLLYDDETWETLREKTGVKRLIEYVKEQYWDKYEAYLISKMKNHKNLLLRQRAKELLQQYYLFLRAFNMKPNDMPEDIYIIWNEVMQEKSSTTNNIYKEAIDIIKNNTTTNIKAVNEEIMKLMKCPQLQECFQQVEEIDDAL